MVAKGTSRCDRDGADGWMYAPSKTRVGHVPPIASGEHSLVHSPYLEVMAEIKDLEEEGEECLHDGG